MSRRGSSHLYQREATVRLLRIRELREDDTSDFNLLRSTCFVLI